MVTFRFKFKVVVAVAGLAIAGGAVAEEKVTYDGHVYPVLRKHCMNCHNDDKTKGDLNLSNYKGVLRGGGSGESVVPGNADGSILVESITHAPGVEQMPPKKPKIPADQIDTIKAWINGGLLEADGSVAKTSNRKVVDFNTVSVKDGIKGVAALPRGLPTLPDPKHNMKLPVMALATSPFAPVAAVASHERILLYNTKTKKSLGALAFPERVPHVLTFSRNGELLLAAGGRGAHSGKVVVYDVKTGKRKIEVGDEFDSVLAADISADHKYIALGGTNKLIKIYSTATGEELHKIKKHTDWVTFMQFSPDGTMLATGDRSGGLHVWDPEVGGIVFTLDMHKQMITGLSWRADGKLLASGAEDGKLVLWDMEEGWDARRAEPHKKGKVVTGIMSVSYAKNGQLVSCGRDGTVRVMDGACKIKATFKAFKDVPTRVAFNFDNASVLAGDYTGAVQLVNAKDGKALGRLGK
jgi:WD40 repeat protein